MQLCQLNRACPLNFVCFSLALIFFMFHVWSMHQTLQCFGSDSPRPETDRQTEIEEGSRRAKSTPHVQLHAGMQGGVRRDCLYELWSHPFSLTLYSCEEKKKSRHIQGILKQPTKARTVLFRPGQHGWWIFFKNKTHNPADVNSSTFLPTGWGHPSVSEIRRCLHTYKLGVCRAKEHRASADQKMQASIWADLRYIHRAGSSEIVSRFPWCSSLLPSGCKLVVGFISDLQGMLKKTQTKPKQIV